MSRPMMSKSALALAKQALEMARRSCPAYTHQFSPKKFTAHQLFAILAVRQFFHLDLRSMQQLLEDWSDLREALGLKSVPNYSTLSKAHARLLKNNSLNSSSTAASVPPVAAA